MIKLCGCLFIVCVLHTLLICHSIIVATVTAENSLTATQFSSQRKLSSWTTQSDSGRCSVEPQTEQQTDQPTDLQTDQPTDLQTDKQHDRHNEDSVTAINIHNHIDDDDHRPSGGHHHVGEPPTREEEEDKELSSVLILPGFHSAQLTWNGTGERTG